jgi:AcrR family transcriptional regulator
MVFLCMEERAEETAMRKGEATRLRIIEQAAPIFNQRGFEGCSMNDLMAATGLKRGGIYRYFATKEELAAEAFRYAMARTVRGRTDGLDDVTGAVAKLRKIIERFIAAPAGVDGGCPLMNTAIDADDGNPELRRLALEGIRRWRGSLSGIVEAGVKAGEIVAGTDPSRIANTIIATLEGALMISRLERSTKALEDAQASLEAVLGEISRDGR